MGEGSEARADRVVLRTCLKLEMILLLVISVVSQIPNVPGKGLNCSIKDNNVYPSPGVTSDILSANGGERRLEFYVKLEQLLKSVEGPLEDFLSGNLLFPPINAGKVYKTTGCGCKKMNFLCADLQLYKMK